MGEQPRLPAGHSAEPMLSAAVMAEEASVFPHGPAGQEVVEMTENRGTTRTDRSALVLNPTPEDGFPHARQVGYGLVAPHGQSPANSDMCSNVRAGARQKMVSSF
jgi:hypothetical protein